MSPDCLCRYAISCDVNHLLTQPEVADRFDLAAIKPPVSADHPHGSATHVHPTDPGSKYKQSSLESNILFTYIATIQCRMAIDRVVLFTKLDTKMSIFMAIMTLNIMYYK